MATTYTPAMGNSPQSLQQTALTQTLQGMGPLPAPQQQTAQAAIQSGGQAQQNVVAMGQQYPQFVGQQGSQLGGMANFAGSQDANSELQKQYALFQHDMQMGATPGVTGVPTQPTTPAPNAQGGSTMTAADISNPLAYGIQLGQSNPTAGLTFLNKGLSTATDAAKTALGDTEKFNLAQFSDQLGQAKDVYQMKYQSEKDKETAALDALKTIISAVQSQRDYGLAADSNRTAKATAAATLRSAGMGDDQISKLLGIPSSDFGSSGTSDITQQANDLATSVRLGKTDFKTASALASLNPATKIAFDKAMAGNIGLGASEVPAGQAYSTALAARDLLQKIDTQKLDVSGGILGTGIGRGADTEVLLNALQALNPTAKRADLEATYIPHSISDPQYNAKIEAIRQQLNTIDSQNPEGYHRYKLNTSGMDTSKLGQQASSGWSL